jgi:hypothetical protein
MAQPNGIGKLGDSGRDPKVDRKTKQKQYQRSSSIQSKQVPSHHRPMQNHHHQYSKCPPNVIQKFDWELVVGVENPE